MHGGTHLYIIQSRVTGAFKVGRSSDPERRLKELQTGSPHELRIILVLENQGPRERILHRKLAGYRSQGHQKGEWFIEPALASLPDDVYGQFDLEMVSTWWESDTGPLDVPGPPSISRR